MSRKVVMGADPMGATLKNVIREHLSSKGYEVIDLGTDRAENAVDYPEIAAKVARAVQKGVADRGILFCGTGMGVAITANKFKGIYCGLVESEFTAKKCRAINNCNVLSMGWWIISENRAKEAVDNFLSTEFTEGFESAKDDLQRFLIQLAEIEKGNFK